MAGLSKLRYWGNAHSHNKMDGEMESGEKMGPDDVGKGINLLTPSPTGALRKAAHISSWPNVTSGHCIY
jgi:hypothetical protein